MYALYMAISVCFAARQPIFAPLRKQPNSFTHQGLSYKHNKQLGQSL